MKVNGLIISLVVISGCSTLKQSMSTASIIGGIAGGIAGGILSPNKPSILPNVVFFGALGAVAGGRSHHISNFVILLTFLNDCKYLMAFYSTVHFRLFLPFSAGRGKIVESFFIFTCCHG